jgi:magnesium-transporting ATPase (P-type)
MSYFFEKRYHPFVEGVLALFTNFALTTTMVPISLIISLEFVKLCQAAWIKADEFMYNKEIKKGVNVLSSSLNEELGQVAYIFCDKTGTLTSNVMVFKFALIGNTLYGDTSILGELKKIPESPQLNQRPKLVRQVTYQDLKGGVEYDFNDRELNKILRDETFKGAVIDLKIKDSCGDNNQPYIYKHQTDLVDDFFYNLALCNECLIERDEGDQILAYQGPSPDEITLVTAAKELGFQYEGNDTDSKTCNRLGPKRFKVHRWIEFNSDRKRASIIMTGPDGIIRHYMKGADSIMLGRMAPASENPFIEINKKYINEFSTKGFRTLAYGMKVYTSAELEGILEKIRETENMEKGREEAMDLLYDNIEMGFTLLGCTAVEDKLQDKVPSAIADFLKADIKVIIFLFSYK